MDQTILLQQVVEELKKVNANIENLTRLFKKYDDDYLTEIAKVEDVNFLHG